MINKRLKQIVKDLYFENPEEDYNYYFFKINNSIILFF